MRKILKAFGLAVWGGDELLIAALSCGSAAYVAYQFHPLLVLIPAIPFLIVLQFFRDPNRTGPSEPDLLLAPADGTIADISEVDEPLFIGGRAHRIGIFLSPFNVHVNRTPCEGIVRWVKFNAGEFLPAYNPEAPHRNESCTIGLELGEGTKLLVKQITGVLARRIVCDARPGDALGRGSRYGMIKFGSRTELYVPVGSLLETRVKVGDKVTGGQTVFCRIRLAPLLDTTGEKQLPVFEGAAALPDTLLQHGGPLAPEKVQVAE